MLCWLEYMFDLLVHGITSSPILIHIYFFVVCFVMTISFYSDTHFFKYNHIYTNDKPLCFHSILHTYTHTHTNQKKSALINRILGRKRAKSSNTPGVTRSLQWIRVRSETNISVKSSSSSSSTSKQNKNKQKFKKEFELLDSPGIIPANMQDQQSDAMILSICNSIGTNAYDNQAVASYFMEYMKTLHIMKKEALSAPVFREKCIERYRMDPMEPIALTNPNGLFEEEEEEGDGTTTRFMTGEDMLYQVADNVCRGDPENAARKILQDFRTGE